MRSTTSCAWLLLCGLLGPAAACSKSPVASPDASVAVDAGAHEAVDRCVEAMSASLSREAGPRPTDAQTAHACAPMFKEPACRQAHLRVHDRPDASSFIVLSVACRDAYCPQLPAPKPEICAAGGDGHAAGVMMPDFYKAIVEHDYDSVQAERIVSVMRAASAE